MEFIERIKQAPKSNKIKFAIVTILYVIWTVWVENLWLLLLIPFIFDIYISKYIPWGFWKKSKNKRTKKVMEWVDAILFALIAVYFINTFFFQNYQIPTSSLEKSLLVGDFLFVGKYNYGARVPNTPLSFPLAQHTLPILDCKSYIDWPQWPYKRLKGPGTVQRYDIVVFNYPSGDTVALNCQQSDYYTICMEAGIDSYYNMTGTAPDPKEIPFEQIMNWGRKCVKNNEGDYGKIVSRPVDRRENYVKRCVGLPGDTLQIIDAQLFINGEKQKDPEKMQLNYIVETTAPISEQNFRKLNISVEDRHRENRRDYLYRAGVRPDSTGVFTGIYYLLPLTQESLNAMKNFRFVKKVVVAPNDSFYEMYKIFPLY